MVGPNEKLRVLRRLPEVVFDEEMHGYNKHQVDKVLDRLAPLADEVDALLGRLSEAEQRAAAAEARLVEQGSQPSGQAGAAPQAIQAPADFDETLSKTLLLAQRTADMTVKEAEETAERIRSEAASEATERREAAASDIDRLRAENEAEQLAAAEQASREVAESISAARNALSEKVSAAELELSEAHESTRADLISQIAALQRTRDALAADVDHFEGHLAARRETIRDAVAELSAVVEDPERLRTTMPPTPAAIADDNVVDNQAISIDVPSLDSLADGVSTHHGSELSWTSEEEHGDEVHAADPGGDATADDLLTDPDFLAEAARNEMALGDDVSDGGEATEAVPIIFTDDDSDHSGNGHGHQGSADDINLDAQLIDSDGVARPAWADSVPDAEVDLEAPSSGDPFLDELRRVTTEDGGSDDDQALANFLSEDSEDDKGGWFGRRR